MPIPANLLPRDIASTFTSRLLTLLAENTHCVQSQDTQDTMIFNIIKWTFKNFQLSKVSSLQPIRKCQEFQELIIFQRELQSVKLNESELQEVASYNRIKSVEQCHENKLSSSLPSFLPSLGAAIQIFYTIFSGSLRAACIRPPAGLFSSKM